MKINFEFELNRAWITDNDGEAIGETNFVVPGEWMNDLFDKLYSNRYSSLDEFINVYEPEVEGEFIYQEAIKNGVLVEDFGVVMYEV